MQTILKHAFLPVSVTAALFIGGCNSDSASGDDTEVIVQKAQSYYRVYDAVTDTKNGKVYIASKEGLSVGRIDAGSVAFDKTYGDGTIISPFVRCLALDKNGKYIVIGTENGISISLLNSDGTLGTTSSYLDGNNTNDMVLAGNLLIASSYGNGLKVNAIDAAGQINSSFIELNAASTPSLPQDTVTALALDATDTYLLIGTQREGVAVAHIDASAARIDTITHYTFAESGIRFVSDIAVHAQSGMVAVAGRKGITTAVLSNGTLQFHQHYALPLLPFKQYTEVAISHDGSKIAAGTYAQGFFVADLDGNGTLANIKTYTAESTPVLNNNHIFSLTFSDDDTRLLVGSQSAEADNITAIEL